MSVSSRILVICGKFSFSAFIRRKLGLRLIECFQVLTVRLLLLKEDVVSGFNDLIVVILMSRIGMAVEKKKFSKIPNWRQYLLKTRAKPYQTQEELAESLGVTQQAISKRLKAMEMIQKQGNWVPYELKPRDVKRRFFACEQLLRRKNRNGFLHRIVNS